MIIYTLGVLILVVCVALYFLSEVNRKARHRREEKREEMHERRHQMLSDALKSAKNKK